MPDLPKFGLPVDHSKSREAPEPKPVIAPAPWAYPPPEPVPEPEPVDVLKRFLVLPTTEAECFRDGRLELEDTHGGYLVKALNHADAVEKINPALPDWAGASAEFLVADLTPGGEPTKVVRVSRPETPLTFTVED